MEKNIIQRKQVISDWNEYFPLLSPYGTISLMMRLDIFLIGVRIERSVWGGDSYIPRFSILALWSKNKDGSFKRLISQDLRTKGHVQYFFNSGEYHTVYKDIMACAEEQFGFFFKEQVLLSDFFRYLSWFNSCERHGKPFLSDEVDAYQLFFALALYVNENRLIEMLTQRLERDCKDWNNDQFHYIYHVDINNWKEKQYDLLTHRDLFLNTIERNTTIPKMARLKEGHIINDVDTVLPMLKTRGKGFSSIFSLFAN